MIAEDHLNAECPQGHPAGPHAKFCPECGWEVPRRISTPSSSDEVAEAKGSLGGDDLTDPTPSNEGDFDKAEELLPPPKVLTKKRVGVVAAIAILAIGLSAISAIGSDGSGSDEAASSSGEDTSLRLRPAVQECFDKVNEMAADFYNARVDGSTDATYRAYALQYGRNDPDFTKAREIGWAAYSNAYQHGVENAKTTMASTIVQYCAATHPGDANPSYGSAPDKDGDGYPDDIGD